MTISSGENQSWISFFAFSGESDACMQFSKTSVCELIRPYRPRIEVGFAFSGLVTPTIFRIFSMASFP